jgi:excisionase family DNA binding protein
MRTGTEKSDLLTVREVAAEWRQHPATIYRKISTGELHAVRLGDETAALRVRRDELERIYADPGVSSSPRPDPAERRAPERLPAVEARPPTGEP